MKKKGKIIVISAPSGGGKSTIIKEILKDHSNIKFSISATTRKPRDGERDGIEYFFLSKDKFDKKIEQNEFLEYKEVYGNYYGTLKKNIDQYLDQGISVILDIDVKGAITIKEENKDTLLIFICPPSLDTLENRLRKRKTDSEEVIKARLKLAKWEISQKKYYDYTVENKILEKTVSEVLEILKKNNIL